MISLLEIDRESLVALQEDLKNAWDKVPIPEGESAAYVPAETYKDEFGHVWETFANKKWDHVSTDDFGKMYGGIGMLHPPGKAYYIASYISLLLSDRLRPYSENYDPDVLNDIQLVLHNNLDRKDFIDNLNLDQLDVIYRLAVLCKEDPDYPLGDYIEKLGAIISARKA